MIEITFKQIFLVIGFLGGSYISLLIHIYKSQTKKIAAIEKEQKNCPINKLYTLLEKLKTDICWIKKEIQKKT